MVNTLKTQIIGSYDGAMEDYLESEKVKKAIMEWNQWYRSLRDRIDPELRQEFDELLRADEDMMQATAEEALYRGVMLGIQECNNINRK